jgi:hypothetical protein
MEIGKKIGNQTFGRVAILVLNYDASKEKDPSKAVIQAYESLNKSLREKYRRPSGLGHDVAALANEELVAKHQVDFEKLGLTFFPNWRESKEYRDLLREGLRQGTDMHIMQTVDRGEYGHWQILRQVTADELVITDPTGKIDIKPRYPVY